MSQYQSEDIAKVSKPKVYLQTVGVKISSTQLEELRKIVFERNVCLSEYLRGVISAHLSEPQAITVVKTALRDLLDKELRQVIREVMIESKKEAAKS